MEAPKDIVPKSPDSVIIKKGPQELAAQVDSIYGVSFFENNILNSKERQNQYKGIRQKVTSLLEAGVDDSSLQKELDELYEQGLRSGIFKATEGVSAAQDLERVKEKTRTWSNSEEEAEKKATEILDGYGYVKELRVDRKWNERQFNQELDKFIEANPLDPKLEAQRIADLEAKTFHTERLTPEDMARLRVEFLGGNFLYHGTRTAQMVKILSGGELLSSKGIYEREKKKAGAEGRAVEFFARNSGYEGISWSMNNIHALPGDRYHIAGFLASPARVLQEDQQLTVPSRPSPYEVIQINGDLDPNKYYGLKTQEELLLTPGLMGEANSVHSNLMEIYLDFKRDEEARTSIFGTPMLKKLFAEKTPEEIQEMVKGKYTVRRDGTINLAEDLLQPVANAEIPPGAVWLQALIDTGRIKKIPELAEAKTVHEILAKLSEQTAQQLLQESKMDKAYLEEIEKQEGIRIDEMEDSTEDLYVVLPEKDLSRWLPVIARCAKQPRGIIAFNHQKVKLENWASTHKGDSSALENQLRLAIPANQEGWIDWEKQVLGVDVTPDKMAGSKKHVVAERYLINRKSIRKDLQGNLIIH